MPLPTEHERAFVGHLMRLADPEHREGRAALAALRRGLAGPPGETVEMYPYVVSWAPQDSGWREKAYYIVASLFALHPLNLPNTTEDDRATNLGRSLREAKGESGGAESRLVALLKSDEDELRMHLRQAVGLCRAGRPELGVDWAQLLHDIGRWSSPSQATQRRWAWSFWRHTPEQEDEGAPPDETSSVIE